MDYSKNIQKMLANSLELQAPWYIENALFDDKEKVFRIYVNVEKSAKFVCPKCGAETRRNGYETEERNWRHNDAIGFQCYVHCRRPKVLCVHCGSQQISAPYERKNSRFTFAFEGYAMMILPNMPVAQTAKLLRCDEESLSKILHYWVNEAVENTDLSEVKSLAIDETSFKKGHSYVTVVIDQEKRCVIGVEKGKDKEAVAEFAKKLEKKGGNCGNITVVTSDMSSSFLPAIAENFPNAMNIIDKFHVKKVMIEALDQVRKDEQKVAENKKELFGSRRLLMIPERKLTEKQREKINSISKSYPKSGKAYQIVSAFDDFYLCETREEAEFSLKKLYFWMTHSRLEPMKKAAKTLKNHWEKILLFFEFPYTNAISEGINSLIQMGKRRARGFHTFEGFSAMIYLMVGKLNLAVPKPF